MTSKKHPVLYRTHLGTVRYILQSRIVMAALVIGVLGVGSTFSYSYVQDFLASREVTKIVEVVDQDAVDSQAQKIATAKVNYTQALSGAQSVYDSLSATVSILGSQEANTYLADLGKAIEASKNRAYVEVSDYTDETKALNDLSSRGAHYLDLVHQAQAAQQAAQQAQQEAQRQEQARQETQRQTQSKPSTPAPQAPSPTPKPAPVPSPAPSGTVSRSGSVTCDSPSTIAVYATGSGNISLTVNGAPASSGATHHGTSFSIKASASGSGASVSYSWVWVSGGSCE